MVKIKVEIPKDRYTYSDYAVYLHTLKQYLVNTDMRYSVIYMFVVTMFDLKLLEPNPWIRR